MSTESTSAENTNIWALDRFDEAGADIVRDIKVSKFKADHPANTRSRSQSYSGNYEFMRSEKDENQVSSGEIAIPGGFRRSFVEDKFNLKFEFEPFVSTCVLDGAFPTIQEETESPGFTKGNIIGIGGGVGPAAGVALHSKIIENTVTDGTDQTHFEVYHLSRSNDLPDRTRFVLGLSQLNPADGLARTMNALHAASSSFGQRAVAGIPCNTFHAPPIWSSFVKQVEASCGSRVKLVHMLEETMGFIRSLLPNVKKIGVMSTTGTRQSKVYDQLLTAQGYECLWVPDESQAGLHDAIYNREWGIKAVFPVSETAREKFLSFAHHLAKDGAQAIILGCTEIPLALPEDILPGTQVVLVDPVLALARALIREADSAKLKPLTPLVLKPEAPESPVLKALSPLESKKHANREEWLDENSLSSEWDSHFLGRPAKDVRVHHLLMQQQQDILDLRIKMSDISNAQSGGSTAPDKSKVDFTHIRSSRMDGAEKPEAAKPSSTKDGKVSVIVRRGSVLGQDIQRAMSGIDLDSSADGEDPLSELDTGRHDQPEQARSRSASRSQSDEKDDQLAKYMKTMIAMTVFCCISLFLSAVLAYYAWTKKDASQPEL